MATFLQILEHQWNFLKPSSFIITPLFLFFTLYLIKWFVHRNTKVLKNLPPSPPKLPLIGNIHQLGAYPHHSLQKLSQRYGPIVFLYLGNSPAVLISSPDLAREVLQSHIFVDRPENKLFRKLVYNMQDIGLAPYGEYWRQLKSICTQQLLSKSRVQSFRTIREVETAILMEKIKRQYCGFSKPVNVSELFSSMSNNIVCMAAFGKKYDGGKKEEKFWELLHDFSELLNSLSVEDYLPWLLWVNYVNGKNAKADRVAKEFDDFFEEVLEERLGLITCGRDYEELNKENIGESLLDTLVRIHKDDEGSKSLGRDSVKAIILDMFIGGTDTTTAVLEWAMSELLRQPRVMKKLQDEVRGIMNGKQDVEEVDIQNMLYLKASVKETLRLHPPFPISGGNAIQDTKVDGYDIPAGSLALVNTWAVARDPSLWDDPEEFKPERFLNSSIDFKGQDFEFLPFGSGRRACPGMSFATAIIELALANVMNNFNWKLPDGVNGDDLDMSEAMGLTACRKVPLIAIPTAWS